MSLKIRIPARLKSLYSGVALSKKSIEAITEKLSTGLTDESTDEEIDAVLNQRNDTWSFDEQRRYDDYQAGKAAKEAADRLKASEEGRQVAQTEDVDPNETKTEKMLRLLLEKQEKQDAAIASMLGEKVATTRKQVAAERLKDAPESYRNDVLADMEEISFRDEDHLNSYLERKVTAASAFAQEQSNAGLGSDRVTAGMGKPNSNEKEVSFEMKELIAERTAKAEAKALQN